MQNQNNDVCKIKILFMPCQLAYVMVHLKNDPFIHRKDASISISSKQSGDIIILTPQLLDILYSKIQRAQFDGIIHTNGWLAAAAAAPSHQMKLYKYGCECGAFFLLDYQNCRIKIDKEVVAALIIAKLRVHSFVASE